MRWTCDTSNITWRSKSSNDAWKCLKSALDFSDCPVMHSRLTDLPPKTPNSQTSSDGTVERSVSVEHQIAGTYVQWPPTPTWGGLSGTVERSHVANGMPVLPACSAPDQWRRASAALHAPEETSRCRTSVCCWWHGQQHSLWDAQNFSDSCIIVKLWRSHCSAAL